MQPELETGPEDDPLYVVVHAVVLDDGREGRFHLTLVMVHAVVVSPFQRLVRGMVGLEHDPVVSRQFAPGSFTSSG